jgi:quercetin dioxygenase-like cupin family protein
MYILKKVMTMTNQTYIKNDSEYPWEYDPGEEGFDDVIRWRTLICGEKTSTEGISMGTLEIPPGAVLDAHHHSSLEVYYLISGEGRLLCGDTVKHVRAGDVVYIPANQVHGIKNISDHTLTLVWMFPTDTWSEIEYHNDHEPMSPIHGALSE